MAPPSDASKPKGDLSDPDKGWYAVARLDSESPRNEIVRWGPYRSRETAVMVAAEKAPSYLGFKVHIEQGHPRG